MKYHLTSFASMVSFPVSVGLGMGGTLGGGGQTPVGLGSFWNGFVGGIITIMAGFRRHSIRRLGDKYGCDLINP